MLDEDERSPSPSTLRRLRPVEIRNPEDFGPALARSRAGGEVEARAAYAPDGSVLSVYFFARGEELPLLRQEDSVGDGRPDRWIGYEAGLRREVWEDGAGRGRPDIRVEFLPGSREIVQIEYDDDADGRVDRRSFFRRGRLLRREILAGDGP